MFSRSGSALFIFGASIVIRDLFISGFEEFAKALGVGRFHNYILNPESKKEAYLSIIGFGILILGEIMTSYGDLIMLKLLK